MSAVVTDTHSLIWYLFEPDLLSKPAQNALKVAENVGVIYVPTICIVEIRYLIEKQVIREDVFETLLDALLGDRSAPTPVPPTLEIARFLGIVPKSEVPDMPDRIIAATALFLNLPLITRDRKIRASSVMSVW